MKINVSVTLFTCKTCGATHNNGFTHTCVLTMADLGAPASMRKARDKKRAEAAKKRR